MDDNQNSGNSDGNPSEKSVSDVSTPDQQSAQGEKCVTCGSSATGGTCVACSQGEITCTCQSQTPG